MYKSVTQGPTTFTFSQLAASTTSEMVIGDYIPSDEIRAGMLVINASAVTVSGGATEFRIYVRAASRLASGQWAIDTRSNVADSGSGTLVNAASGMYRFGFKTNNPASDTTLPGPALVVVVAGSMGATPSSPVLTGTFEIGVELVR